VSQPGLGLESAYSGPRVELRPPVHPTLGTSLPVLRADLVLVDDTLCTLVVAVIRGGMAIGWVTVRPKYAEGGTRLGCVRGALGSICFIARLALIPLLHAVP
jgi:hypothetical protein